MAKHPGGKTRPKSRKFGHFSVVPVLVLAVFAAHPAVLHAANTAIGFSARVVGSAGQVLAPLAAETVSFTSEAGLRLVVSNPGSRSADMRLGVYDDRFRPVAAEVFPATIRLDAGASHEMIVIVPFGNVSERRLNICVEREYGTATPVCGRYTVRRAALD